MTHRTRASEGSAEDDDDGSIQLGTAKLPVGVNERAVRWIVSMGEHADELWAESPVCAVAEGGSHRGWL